MSRENLISGKTIVAFEKLKRLKNTIETIEFELLPSDDLEIEVNGDDISFDYDLTKCLLETYLSSLEDEFDTLRDQVLVYLTEDKNNV